jgi:rSAM/selenodomain-associated transferase 2
LRISVVVPVFNEAYGKLAESIASAAAADEIIVVDGGSTDGTQALVALLPARLISSKAGRASQMNAGAQLATGDMFLFLHADVTLPADWRGQIHAARAEWGRFDVCFESNLHDSLVTKTVMKVVAGFMNFRSRHSLIATGDQALFFTRQVFSTIGGFPDQLLMEDVEICRRLKQRRSRPVNIPSKVQVSPRRWKNEGYFKTILLMWRLRWQYWRGASAESLHSEYYGSRR